MADRAKHAHGSRSNLNAAISSGKVNEFDVLFLSGKDENPALGWVDKNGNPIIISPADEVSKLETEVEAKLATKANADEIEAIGLELASKASAEELQAVDAKISTKADVSEVEAKISKATTDSIASAKEYANKLVEAAMDEHLTKKYEITDVPKGTLVTYRENEIRVMCPADATFVKQNVGAGGDVNNYYMTFKTYAPSDDAVGYIEHLGDKSDSEILYDFKTDEFGKRYQPTWLGIAKYDETTNAWNYYGNSSSANKFIGWDYQIDWFNADGVMIASDSIRINLTNEDCHHSIEPYYVTAIKTEVDEKIEIIVEEKIKKIESSYEIIEF